MEAVVMLDVEVEVEWPSEREDEEPDMELGGG